MFTSPYSSWTRLKCDRDHPCDNCVKRGLSLSCTYVNFSKTFASPGPTQARPPAYQKLQERIGQLEDLVASRMNDMDQGVAESINTSECSSLSPNTATNQSSPSQTSSSRKGRIRREDAGTIWVEDDHWTAILDGISELKDLNECDAGDSGAETLDASNSLGPELLLGDRPRLNEQDILAAVPPRPMADRLVSQFLKSVEIAPMVIHIPTFLKEYEHFWEHQTQTPILWVGLLFAIMCLAVIHQQSGFEPSHAAHDKADAGDVGALYRTKTTECLVLGNYTKPSRYTIETLLLSMHVEYVRSQDAQTGLWMLLGMTIRLALRMGYHRDGSDFSSQISPFHAEMRRRVWCIIVMIDAGAAAQFGLPRMVQVPQSSTAEPRNLFDEDIEESMCELPAARPESVQTPVQYFVAKNRIVSVFGKISDLKILTQPPDYGDILKLDGILQGVYDGIPHSLAMRPMSKTITDSPSLIINRIYVALLFLRSKCILHQTYLIPSWISQYYKYSRTACIEAALEIVQIQQILDQETQAGGRLYEDCGKVSSVVRNDFLLATTILCVDINYALTKRPDLALDDKVIGALRSAHLTWLRSCPSSREARQATRAIEVVLAKGPGVDTSTSLDWDGASIDVSITESRFDLTFDDMLMTTNPTLFAGWKGSETTGFPDLSAMDFDMASIKSVNWAWQYLLTPCRVTPVSMRFRRVSDLSLRRAISPRI